ncbi:uncharacterized protein LOC114361708 [Ostrinia furnacalis]|uniref:uncharacterized protein LOC114361708 n=1 Tax=Ostrinia furnacalis TaxID=93504 RepID=UPI00103E3F2E|nr:uncharacterized protein LOC114361708 [Ostrinia furnacalis]
MAELRRYGKGSREAVQFRHPSCFRESLRIISFADSSTSSLPNKLVSEKALVLWYTHRYATADYTEDQGFADDIVVMTETLEDLCTMLNGLSRTFQQVGRKMNIDKTKIMSIFRIAPTLLKVGDSTLEVVDNCVYLGQRVQIGRSNFERSIAEFNSAKQRSGSFAITSEIS